jgi:hypothetical protein
MRTLPFDVWLGRSNVQEIVLREPVSQGGDLVTGLSSITAVEVDISSIGAFSSDDWPDEIWWTDSVDRTVIVDGNEQDYTGDVVKLRLGLPFQASGVVPGDYEACLVGYDSDAVSGTVYADNLLITVIGGCA